MTWKKQVFIEVNHTIIRDVKAQAQHFDFRNNVMINEKTSPFFIKMSHMKLILKLFIMITSNNFGLISLEESPLTQTRPK